MNNFAVLLHFLIDIMQNPEEIAHVSFFFWIERSSLYQTTKVFLAFTEWIAFYHKCTIKTLIDWQIFYGEQIWLVLLNLT